jgi:hypothetical protein
MPLSTRLLWLAAVGLIPAGKPTEENCRKGRIRVIMLSSSRLNMQWDQGGLSESEREFVIHGMDYRGHKITITPMPDGCFSVQA